MKRLILIMLIAMVASMAFGTTVEASRKHHNRSGSSSFLKVYKGCNSYRRSYGYGYRSSGRIGFSLGSSVSSTRPVSPPPAGATMYVPEQWKRINGVWKLILPHYE